MNEPQPSGGVPASYSREEMISALFANMVIQQTNMALMFLGRMPHPETGEHVQDLETAKMFIDQLEMLAVKTKGNLDKQEEAMMKLSLTGLRMAFVEAVEGRPASPTPSAPAQAVTPPPAPAQASAPEPAKEPVAPAPPDESRVKFTKKY